MDKQDQWNAWMAQPVGCLGSVCAMFVVVPIFVLSDALALSLIWGWHLEPMGAPVMSFHHAVGVVLLWFMARWRAKTDDPVLLTRGELLGDPIKKAIILGWVVLFAWGAS